MNLHAVDWVIVLALLALLVLTVASSRKYMRGVADFLSAGRCGGRYVLCVSEGMAGMGAITLLAFWEMYYKGGFTSIWWSLPNWPLIYLLSLSGWVLYRYRRTRAMTMAQFLEMRYSRRFRIFAGILAFTSGVVNFGIFPGVNARFFIYFCGLPQAVDLFGWHMSTFPLVMFCSLSISLFCTFTGGQIAIIMTDFLQGIFSQAVILTTCIVLLTTIGWHRIHDALLTAPPAQSWINPFDIAETEGFNLSYFLIGYLFWFYTWKAWQGTQGYNSSAKTPHEARMAGILGTWRYFAQEMLVPIFAVCAIAVLVHPDFKSLVAPAKETLQGLADNKYTQSQLTVPLALSRIVPVGLMGALAALMMAASLGTEQAYLHSWGSIFVQDVVMPLRGKALSPTKHLWLLRASICGVAVFIFGFSLWFWQTDYIRMYFALTGAIYLGGAGACIVGGLYWKRGTTAAAWTAMTTGSVLAFSGVLLQQIAKAKPGATGVIAELQTFLYQSPGLREAIILIGSFNGQWMWLGAAATAILLYILVSLFSGQKLYNLDQLLHRGQYAVQEDAVEGETGGLWLWRWLGVGKEFSRWDKRIYVASISWIFLWGGVFAFGIIYHLKFGISTEGWASFWHVMIFMAMGLALVVLTVLLIGGLQNLKEMFHLLRTRVRDHTDDGAVRRPGDDAPAS